METISILGRDIPLAPIALDATSLALAESVRGTLMDANAADGLHARQDCGTYGPLREALLTCLSIGIIGPDAMAVGSDQWSEARTLANAVWEVVVDSGESVPYAVNYINERVEEEWCYRCEDQDR